MNKLPKVRIKQVADGGLYSTEKITSPEDAVRLMRRYLKDADREIVLVATFDTAMHPINVTVVSMGTVNGTLAAGREIFKTAILSNATGIIMMHNHPSGDPSPSREDKQLTKSVQEAGNLLGIRLMDHIITTGSSYYSFQEEGVLTDICHLQAAERNNI